MELLFAEAMELLSLVIVKFGECLWDPLKRHTEYLLFYGRNIKTLETQVEKLVKDRNDVQQDVDLAVRRGQTASGNVLHWVKRVNYLESETQNMMARLADTEWWNPVQCHGLGKKAADNIDVANGLLDECKFKRVSRPPPPSRTQSLLPNSGFQALDSSKVPMRHVLNALQDKKIQVIGVYGMGGVGKTMLMKEVAKKVAEEKLFDEVVMVTISQKIMIERIQHDIGRRLGLEFEEDDVSLRAATLLRRLKQVKKLLLILDDLWERLELSDIGIPYGQKGCKIVITTRRLDVCNTMKSQEKIEVTTLSEKDSWNLFEENAGLKPNLPTFFDVARNIVNECKGLPVAIVVLGRALSDEPDVKVWNAVLKSLKQSIPTDIEGLEKEVFRSIKFSFDYLKSNEAELCFLFCCVFPEHYNIHSSKIAWIMEGERQLGNVETFEETQNQVHFLLKKLKASGLLLEDSIGNFRMHDIVRDVGIWIASHETYGFYSKAGAGLKEWPRSMKTEEQQRISLMDNDIYALPEEPLFFPNLRTLLLNNNVNLSRIPDQFFLEMKALEVLGLSNTGISYLPTSISSLTNLKALDLSGCRFLKGLSGIGRLKSLEILDLSKTDANIPPTEFRELSNLKHLVRCRNHRSLN